MIAECGIRIAEYPSLHPSPPRGVGKGEGRFGHLELVLKIYFGFVIWNLGFKDKSNEL